MQKSFGRSVFFMFLAFFGLIILVNSVFIYNALDTHPGVITQNPYEKGLKYNEMLEKARSQPQIQSEINYQNGILSWTLRDESATYIENAHITVKLIRPIKDGDDIETVMDYKGDGLYEVALDLPFEGKWNAHLKAEWDKKEYLTTYPLIVK